MPEAGLRSGLGMAQELRRRILFVRTVVTEQSHINFDDWKKISIGQHPV